MVRRVLKVLKYSGAVRTFNYSLFVSERLECLLKFAVVAEDIGIVAAVVVVTLDNLATEHALDLLSVALDSRAVVFYQARTESL